jgi:hypothetical protein
VLASLLSFRPIQAQQAAAGAMARDSISLRARGAWDGSRAAEQRSTTGAFYGGMASSALAWVGLAVALPIANRRKSVLIGNVVLWPVWILAGFAFGG